MAHMTNTLVMDVSPWPSGQGFSGSREWWSYLHNKDERKRLDQLLGAALLDQKLCNRLIQDRDEELLTAFGLSDITKQWIQTVSIASLSDLAEAIVSAYS
jgi:hypothetical protein